MATQVGSRLAYQTAKNAINNAGFSVGQAVLSQGYLRLEVALSTSKTLYQFSILQNDNINGAQFNTEQRLALQDGFYCSSIGLFFGVPASATASNYQLCTYPNSTIFSGANTASSLYNWYNATMQLSVNNRQIVPSYDLYRHYSVPQTQDGTTTIDQQDGGTSGFYPIEPGWVLVGSKTNILTVSLANAMAAVETNSRAILILRGHTAQNVTPVR